ncbi:hypothetical protein RB601_002882 [Gaeumannomyces tritici]
MANTFRHAHSEPINPPGAEPVLTREQVWAGLQRKVRSPTEFVPAIESCQVVSEEGDVVTRIVQFKANWGPSGKVTEVCTSYHPAQILCVPPRLPRTGGFWQERKGQGTMKRVDDGALAELTPDVPRRFEMDSGDRVSNIVSAGPSGESTDMFLTYVFDLQNPKADTEANAKVAKGAVSGTIAKFRELAKAGQI